MFINKLFFPTIVYVILAFSINIFAQDYLSQTDKDAFRLSERGILYDARSLGMGNALSIIGNTYSAMLFNPATLGLAEKFTVSSSVNLNLYHNNARFLSDSTEDTKTETVLNQFGLVYPVSKDSGDNNLVFALGYNQSNDFNRILKFSDFNSSNSSLIQDLTSFNNELMDSLYLSYPLFDPNNNYLGNETIINGNLLTQGSLLEEGGINWWSFGFSYEFASNVFFGGSANYAVGSYTSNREYYEIDEQNVYGDTVKTIPNSNNSPTGFEEFNLNDVVTWSYNGWDIRMGVLYKFFNFISIGGSVKLPTNYSIQEKHYFTGISKFTGGFEKVEELNVIDNNYNVQSPFEFIAGAMVNIWFIQGAVEASYIDYTQMKFTDGLDVRTEARLNKNIQEKYTQVINARAGLEFRLPFTGLSARAGFMYNMSPLQDAPTDYDKKYLTAGVGIRSGEGDFEFNLAYAHGWWDQISGEFGTRIPTISESITTDNIMISATLRFN